MLILKKSFKKLFKSLVLKVTFMQSNIEDSEDQKLLTITEKQLYRPSQTCINCTEARKVKAKNADNIVPSL